MIDIRAEFLKEIKQSNMTIKEIAQKSGVAESSINQWLHCRVMPSLENAQKVLDAMGLELLIFEKIDGE